MLFLGDDWAEAHHDIELQDAEGKVLIRRRPPEGVAGLAELHGLVGDHLGEDEDPGQVWAINPVQAARYRDRHSASGAKSDPGDAHVLAEIVRLDRAHHRPVAGDSAVAEHIKVAARAHQTMIWTRQRNTAVTRSMLREYYPAALIAFEDLASRDALAVLAAAPSPEQGRKLTVTRVEALLRRAGRQRYVTARATEIVTALRSEQLPARPGVVDAYAAAVRALVAVTTEMVCQVAALEAEVKAGFGQHPDVEIYLSQPGLGVVLGARVLGEFGDDPDRYLDSRARKNYSGMAPVTRASGTKRVVLARHNRNQRLADALYQQAFAAITRSPGARAFYDRHRDRGATHHQALRALANRLVGILHGCLAHHSHYDETVAWPPEQTLAA
ncbi:MAG: IS110 family transposase [Janthinobacterium lividum]